MIEKWKKKRPKGPFGRRGNKQVDQVATRVAERQRMEDGLWARIEAAERVVAAAGYLDLGGGEAQRQKRMAELHKMDNACSMRPGLDTKPL